VPDIRLAVSGLADAGKTVFITQLVSHLEHFKRGRFDLGDGRTITDVKLAAVEVPGVKPFPYQEARNHLLGWASHWPPATREPDPDWPPATREVTGLRVEFTLVDEGAWFFTRWRYHVEIYDFPGELLVDLNLPDRSFAAWSEGTLSRLRDPVSPLHAAGVKYLRHLAAVSADPDHRGTLWLAPGLFGHVDLDPERPHQCCFSRGPR